MHSHGKFRPSKNRRPASTRQHDECTHQARQVPTKQDSSTQQAPDNMMNVGFQLFVTCIVGDCFLPRQRSSSRRTRRSSQRSGGGWSWSVGAIRGLGLRRSRRRPEPNGRGEDKKSAVCISPAATVVVHSWILLSKLSCIRTCSFIILGGRGLS